MLLVTEFSFNHVSRCAAADLRVGIDCYFLTFNVVENALIFFDFGTWEVELCKELLEFFEIWAQLLLF